MQILGRDIAAVQRRALCEGTPYKTLVSSISYKYVYAWFREI
jgi:predicted DNA binding CopG/RHH family protein